MSRILIGAVLLAFSSLAFAFDLSGTGTIYKASDGDTFWVTGIEKDVYWALWERSGDKRHFNHHYRSVKMRLDNVDTAESNHYDKRENSDFGRTISAHMKRLSKNQPARFRCWDIGNHNRPICQISLANIGDIGLYLIENGLSDYITAFGRHPFQHAAYQQAARE